MIYLSSTLFTLSTVQLQVKFNVDDKFIGGFARKSVDMIRDKAFYIYFYGLYRDLQFKRI